ncbi:MAG: 23S rRNA (adenine(2503)-C(2))-methyltransferase RlmN [bacterium]
MNKVNLKGLSRKELDDFIADIGEKSFRSSQIWAWIYGKGLTSFDGMTNISRDLRNRLDQIAVISSLKLVHSMTSSQSQTQKFLWELEDGLRMESVFIPDGKRRTVCISSQVGCSLGCTFCATGVMGFFRNLEPHEIVDQVLAIQRQVGEKSTNVVVMGMGEPFLNYENVVKALSIINDPEGVAISHRKITISTAGIVPQIFRYAEEGRPFKLAISLNATTDIQRSRLMPVNKKYPLRALLEACKTYTVKQRKRLTFEYVLLRGENDTRQDAHRLLTLLKGIPCKVNLIAYNRTTDAFARPDEAHIQTFAESIRYLCAPVTLRLSRGDDIDGACGQLAASKPLLS